MGYLASLKNYCAGGPTVTSTPDGRPGLEQVHFIGKDIVTFHTLFWPAMLHFSGRKVPDKVFVHGFITVNGGEKMSKSRGTGISPLKYLELGMNAEWLRYYIAAKLNASRGHRLQPDDFVARVNSDLVGKYINIASRAAGFLAKRFGGHLSADIGVEGRTLLDGLRAARASRTPLRGARVRQGAARDHGAGRPRQRLRRPAQALGAGQAARRDAVLHDVCTVCIEAFRALTIYLKPVLPALAAQVGGLPAMEPLTFADAARALGRHAIGEPGLPAPDAARRPAAAGQAVRAAAPPVLPPPGGEARSPPRSSASTTSPRSTCASPRSSPQNTSRAATSCCA